MNRAIVILVLFLALFPAANSVAAKDYERGLNAFKRGEYELAFREIKSAAEEDGHKEAQTMLGILYHLGKGPQQDQLEAVVWLRKSADQGDALAQHILGDIYYHGKGNVGQDHNKAAEWYQKASTQGDVDAQYKYAHMLAQGEGGERDAFRAYIWFTIAADNGHEKAEGERGPLDLSITEKTKAKAVAKTCRLSRYFIKCPE